MIKSLPKHKSKYLGEFTENFIDSFFIKFELTIPQHQISDDFSLWAQILIEKDSWLTVKNENDIDTLSGNELVFLDSFLQTSLLLCQLGRLPIFDFPQILSLSRDSQSPAKLFIEIKISRLHFLPEVAYLIPLKSSLRLCQWMVQHKPTSENKRRIFDDIAEKVIKPLQRIVPGGKSTIPVLRVAHSLGIPFAHLGLGVYQFGWGSKARRLDRSICELDSAIGSKLTQNKVCTTNILRAAGLPSPVHGVVITEADALLIATKIGFPVVIKPTDLDRGEGVFVDVNDSEAVKLAFNMACKLSRSKQVLVERQVSGVCHRLFIANGKLLYAVKRLPMSIMGDGQRSVAELVSDEVAYQKERAPWNRSEIKLIDQQAIMSLMSAGFSPESIPPDGVWVPLRRIESTADGGVDEEVTAIVHPDNLYAAFDAAELFDLQMAGIDIISPDISKPWYENGAIINEVNFAPLFGGGKISRSYIPKFFKEFIDGDGRIPIEGFNSEDSAIARQKELIHKGVRCYFTTSIRTIDFAEKELVMPFKDIRDRLRALIYRSNVDAIVFCDLNIGV